MGNTQTTNLKAQWARLMTVCVITLLVGLTSTTVMAQIVQGTVAGHELRIGALEGDMTQAQRDLARAKVQATLMERRYAELRTILDTKASATRVLRLEQWKDETSKELKAQGLRIDGLDRAISRAQAAIDSQGELISLVKEKTDQLGHRVDDLDARVTGLRRDLNEVALTAGRAERKADRAQETADSKQGQIEFNLGAGVWMRQSFGIVGGVMIPLRGNWAIEGIFGGGKGAEGFATLGQVVVINHFLSFGDDSFLNLRFGGYWSSDSVSSGTRSFAEKMVGGTAGIGYTVGAFDTAIDAGVCWDSPQQNGKIKDRAAFCGVFRAGFRF